MHIRGRLRRHPLRFLSQLFKIFLFGVLILVFIDLLDHLQLSHYFPIKTVRIYGINHTDQKELETVLIPLVERGFFSINVDMIRDRLRQMPWVSKIFVRRYWPDQVEITLLEKNAIARFNEQSLLTEGGELFIPPLHSSYDDLPQFLGPDGKQIIMLEYFKSFSRILDPLHAKIAYLELTPYYTWKITLTNGMTLQIGHKDILTRLRHFVKVYPKIVGARAKDVEYIDLRYSNGMAIRWKGALKV